MSGFFASRVGTLPDRLYGGPAERVGLEAATLDSESVDILAFLLGTSLGFSLGALGAWWLSRHPEAPTLLDSTRARAAEIAKRAHELLALLKIRAHELPALLKIRVHELDALLERSMGERTSSAALVSKNLLVGALVLGTWYGLATGRLVADRESYGSLQLVQQLQEQSGRTVTYAETFDTDVFERRRVTLLDETFDEPLTGVLTLSEGSPEGLSRMRWPNGLLQSNADASTGPVSGRLAYYARRQLEQYPHRAGQSRDYFRRAGLPWSGAGREEPRFGPAASCRTPKPTEWQSWLPRAEGRRLESACRPQA